MVSFNPFCNVFINSIKWNIAFNLIYSNNERDENNKLKTVTANKMSKFYEDKQQNTVEKR